MADFSPASLLRLRPCWPWTCVPLPRSWSAGVHAGAALDPTCSWSCVPLPASWACRGLGGFCPGGPDLRSSPDLGSSALPATVASPLPSPPNPLPPGRPTQLNSSCRSCSCRICSSLSRCRPLPAFATGVAPLPVIGGLDLCLDFLLSEVYPGAWDCSDYGQGEILARLAGDGSGDTHGCRSLLGGVDMVHIFAPPRASGETLGPSSWTGRRRRP